jgi:hypothetical protein
LFQPKAANAGKDFADTCLAPSRHLKNAAPAKAILRISANVASDVAACFWFAFMHVSAKTLGSLRCQKKIQVRTCTSRTSRTSSARDLSGAPPQPGGGGRQRLRQPSLTLFTPMCSGCANNDRLRETVLPFLPENWLVRRTVRCIEPEKVPVASGVLSALNCAWNCFSGDAPARYLCAGGVIRWVAYSKRCINVASDCRRAGLSCGSMSVTYRVVRAASCTVLLVDGAITHSGRVVGCTVRNDNSPKIRHRSTSVKSTKTMIEKS